MSVASVPLKIYEDISAFKLYLLDCGLLGAMANIPAMLILNQGNGNNGKGDFTENYVCTQIKTIDGLSVGYYSKDNSQMEIDFLVQAGVKVFPIEVKAEENLQAKSLKSFLASNQQLHGLRFSMSGYMEQERMTNVPLYAARQYLAKIMEREGA